MYLRAFVNYVVEIRFLARGVRRGTQVAPGAATMAGFARTVERVVLVVVFICAVAGNPNAEPGPDWLARLNLYRATALLPPVVEDPGLSGAVLEHARYMVAHGVVRHSQNRRDRWATPGGAAAAAASNLAGSIRPTEPDSWAVDLWMQAPFHALGILDPGLDHVGFGIHHAPNGRVQTAAGLDVINGRRTAPRSIAYPVLWPANGSSVPLATHTVEDPSPLTSCPGYRAPTGLPLIVQLGAGDLVPQVTASWIVEEGRLLEHCVFGEGTYRNRNAGQQRLARSILAARDAVVLIPREPLRPGSSYRAVVEVDGRLIDWTFAISGGM